MIDAIRICGLVPTYNNPLTVARVVEAMRPHVDEVLIVDDCSSAEGRRVCGQLAERGLAVVLHRETNGGKGAAVQDGLSEASRLGFTHALQIDADAQHDLSAIPRFVAAAKDNPRSLVLAYPEFDATVPKARLFARQITTFWCRVETFGPRIVDPMCGFRIYPVAEAAALPALGQRMDFDPEIAVHLVWAGVPVENLPVRVKYLSEEEGGISHFQMFRDNLRISWMHTRLVIRAITRALTGRVPRQLPAPAPAQEGTKP